MNLTETLHQHNINNIFLSEPIKNNIITNGTFIRILYSSQNVVLNGIYIHLPINQYTIEKYYNKYKCLFDLNVNSEIVSQIKIIERNILSKISIIDKIPQYKLYEQIKYGSFKTFEELSNNRQGNGHNFMLKISGIWETDIAYGLTFKIIMKEE